MMDVGHAFNLSTTDPTDCVRLYIYVTVLGSRPLFATRTYVGTKFTTKMHYRRSWHALFAAHFSTLKHWELPRRSPLLPAFPPLPSRIALSVDLQSATCIRYLLNSLSRASGMHLPAAIS